MGTMFLILYVENPATSASFYSRLLDRSPLEASSTFVMFGLADGVMLGLWIRDEIRPAVSSPPGAMELDLTRSDRAAVDETLAAWRREGIPIDLNPVQLDFGYGFLAHDPDGHRIRVFCPGGA